MQWLSDFLYQLITLFLFVVSLAVMFYFLSEKQQTRFLIFLFASWTLAGAAICLYLNDRVLIEPETGGTLRPARDPNPPTPASCEKVPDDAMRIYLGSSMGWTTNPTCTIVRVAGESLLQIERQKDGMFVNAKIFSQDKRIVAEVKNNKFYINP